MGGKHACDWFANLTPHTCTVLRDAVSTHFQLLILVILRFTDAFIQTTRHPGVTPWVFQPRSTHTPSRVMEARAYGGYSPPKDSPIQEQPSERFHAPQQTLRTILKCIHTLGLLLSSWIKIWGISAEIFRKFPIVVENKWAGCLLPLTKFLCCVYLSNTYRPPSLCQALETQS